MIPVLTEVEREVLSLLPVVPDGVSAGLICGDCPDIPVWTVNAALRRLVKVGLVATVRGKCAADGRTCGGYGVVRERMAEIRKEYEVTK